ncbi:MAG: hypothetical protein ACMZI0_06160 [Symbiopectobacterium sp.]
MGKRSLEIENEWVRQPHLDAAAGISMESRPWTHSDSDLLEKRQKN